MKDSIKEIIEGIKSIAKVSLFRFHCPYAYILNPKQAKLLLNYITSLEQANKNTYETSQDLLSEMQQKIDKAIEYIEYYLRDIDNLDNVMINSRMFKEVLKILKGSDK